MARARSPSRTSCTARAQQPRGGECKQSNYHYALTCLLLLFARGAREAASRNLSNRVTLHKLARRGIRRADASDDGGDADKGSQIATDWRDDGPA